MRSKCPYAGEWVNGEWVGMLSFSDDILLVCRSEDETN